MGNSGASASVVACILLVLAAGCSSPEADTVSTSGLPGSEPALGGNGTASVLPTLLANITTDMLHLLEPPALSLRPANHTVTIAKGAMAQGYAWNMTVRSPAVITGAETVLWLRITGSQVQAGGPDPGCTAVATLTFTINGTASSVAAGCGSAGLGVIPPGDVELRFAAPPGTFAQPLHVGPGDGIRLDITIYTESPSFSPTCFILSDAEHDSHVRLVGLNETVPPLTQAPKATAA